MAIQQSKPTAILAEWMALKMQGEVLRHICRFNLHETYADWWAAVQDDFDNSVKTI